jgi:ubiquinone/menaquinone biosynthesis C-methylase UbiE
MRPQTIADMADCKAVLEKAVGEVSGTLYLNFKSLTLINNLAFKCLMTFLQELAQSRPDLKVKIITTSVLAWSSRKFSILSDISPNFSVEQYDMDFYPGQEAMETETFIPVLRTQTKIIWEQEKYLLPRHGLEKNMKVADICCGIGDFAILLHKHFQPSELVAVDHSKSSLTYARQVARAFQIKGIDFRYGDASALLMEDDYFDFVTCRLSLQIFHQPEKILSELRRIVKPGGRLYLTNETFSKCFGEPCSESISWTYQQASELFAGSGMNLEFGTRMNRYLQEAHMTDIRIEPMILTNTNSDPKAFVEVIKSWKEFIAGELAENANKSEEFRRKLAAGFDDHIHAVSHAKGFAGWPIWVASSTKSE